MSARLSELQKFQRRMIESDGRAVLGLRITGGDLVTGFRPGLGLPCVAWGFEVGALDAPDRMPAGGLRNCAAVALPGWRARPQIIATKPRGAE